MRMRDEGDRNFLSSPSSLADLPLLDEISTRGQDIGLKSSSSLVSEGGGGAKSGWHLPFLCSLEVEVIQHSNCKHYKVEVKSNTCQVFKGEIDVLC